MNKIKCLLASLVLLATGVGAQVPISNLPPATTPLSGSEVMILNQTGFTRQTPISSITSIVPPITAPFVLEAASPTLTNSRVLAGTPNEVVITDGGPLGNLTLSTPQPIATTSSPTFSSLILTNPLTVPNGGTGVNTITGLVLGNGVSAMSPYAGTSCTNQFPRSLNSSGVATCASVANTDLVNSSITINGTAVSLGGTRTLTLASADFVNQGTATTVLHGNAAGNPSFGAVSLTSDVSNVLPTANGGTSFGTYTLGDMLYSSATNTLAKLSGNTTTTKQFLTQTGTGVVSGAPAWGTIAAGDLPGSFSGFANPSGLIGLTAVNGAATTATRSDATHAIDQSIAPTWTGLHTFSAGAKATTTGGFGGTVDFLASAAIPTFGWQAPSNAADQKNVQCYYNGASLLYNCSFVTDNGSAEKVWLSVARGSTTTVSNVTVGNSTDKPTIALQGPTQILGPNTGTGADIRGGSASGDTALVVRNGAGSTNFLLINGVGNQTMAAPTSGDTLTIGGASGGRGIFLNYASGTGASNIVLQSSVGTGSTSIWRMTQSGIVNLDMQLNATTGQWAIVNGGVTSITVQSSGATAFPNIGTTASAANAFLDGAANPANNILRSTSSRRYKTDISDMPSGALDVVMRLRPVKFHSLASADSHKDWFYGLVAEEVASVEPSLIVKDPDGRPDGVQYDRVQVFMLPVVQSMHRQIQWMWACIATLVLWNVYLTLRRGNSYAN